MRRNPYVGTDAAPLTLYAAAFPSHHPVAFLFLSALWNCFKSCGAPADRSNCGNRCRRYFGQSVFDSCGYMDNRRRPCRACMVRILLQVLYEASGQQLVVREAKAVADPGILYGAGSCHNICCQWIQKVRTGIPGAGVVRTGGKSWFGDSQEPVRKIRDSHGFPSACGLDFFASTGSPWSGSDHSGHRTGGWYLHPDKERGDSGGWRQYRSERTGPISSGTVFKKHGHPSG